MLTHAHTHTHARTHTHPHTHTHTHTHTPAFHDTHTCTSRHTHLYIPHDTNTCTSQVEYCMYATIHSWREFRYMYIARCIYKTTQIHTCTYKYVHAVCYLLSVVYITGRKFVITSKDREHKPFQDGRNCQDSMCRHTMHYTSRLHIHVLEWYFADSWPDS